MKEKTNDIYYKIDSKIVSKGFWNVDLGKKKQLIEEEMLHYTIEKAQIYHVNIQQNSDQTMEYLVQLLYDMNKTMTTPEEKHEFFRHYTHYLLAVAGAIQNREILWWQEDTDTLIEKPSIEINEKNQWNSLTTHRDTDPLKTTLLVLDAFQNNFGLDTKQTVGSKLIKNREE